MFHRRLVKRGWNEVSGFYLVPKIGAWSAAATAGRKYKLADLTTDVWPPRDDLSPHGYLITLKANDNDGASPPLPSVLFAAAAAYCVSIRRTGSDRFVGRKVALVGFIAGTDRIR